jgi:hypothetical protein
MSGKEGMRSDLPTQLPARYRTRFAWALDKRSKAVREVARDMVELWQDLGGYEGLSKQEAWLVERVVFLRRRVLAYEAAVMHNLSKREEQAAMPLPMDAGTYSNHVNVMLGLLRALGLERRARHTGRLRDKMVGGVAA